MNANILTGRFVENVYSPEGKQCMLLLIEPNGDQYLLRCLVKAGGSKTDIADDRYGATLTYLIERYGRDQVMETARAITIGN